MTDDRDTVTEPERKWAVYRCPHGCLHLALDHLTLTLTEEEFNALRHLMDRACRRILNGEKNRRSDVRTH